MFKVYYTDPITDWPHAHNITRYPAAASMYFNIVTKKEYNV